MEFLVVISNIDECSEYIGWEYHFEGLPILLYRVKEAQTPEAVQLEFVLNLNIFLRVIEVSLGFFTFIDARAVVHENLANDMRTVKSNLDIVRII